MAMLRWILEIICLLTVELGDRETLLNVIRMTMNLTFHEETLRDTGNRLYTICTLVRKDKWEIERNSVLPKSVSF